MAWQSVYAVIAMDISKIQNVNVVQYGGFGFVKREPEEDTHTPPIIGIGKGNIPR
jgi:hypothetical protein